MKYVNMSGYEFDGVAPKRNPALVSYAVKIDVLAVMYNGEYSATDVSRREIKGIMVFIEVDPRLQLESAFFVELYKSAEEIIEQMPKSEFEFCRVLVEKVSSITKL